MKHKHYDCIVAIAEGHPVEFSYNGQDWKVYKKGFHYSPLDCSPHIQWRIKKEPVIAVKYFRLASGVFEPLVYVEFQPDLEKWDLKITYQDGVAIKAEVTE